MKEGVGLSPLGKESETVKESINRTIVSAAEQIRGDVKNYLLLHPGAIPETLSVTLGVATTPGGGFIKEYLEFNVATEGLSQVTEEHFEFEAQPPIEHERRTAPMHFWLDHGPSFIDVAMTFLKNQHSAQS